MPIVPSSKAGAPSSLVASLLPGANVQRFEFEAFEWGAHRLSHPFESGGFRCTDSPLNGQGRLTTVTRD